jgi:hypothetical protein
MSFAFDLCCLTHLPGLVHHTAGEPRGRCGQGEESDRGHDEHRQRRLQPLRVRLSRAQPVRGALGIHTVPTAKGWCQSMRDRG